MKVKEFKEMIINRFDEDDDECDIVVPVNGKYFDIVGITDHGGYTRRGGLPFELEIK